MLVKIPVPIIALHIQTIFKYSNHIQIKTICKNGFSQQLCDKPVEGILPDKNINK